MAYKQPSKQQHSKTSNKLNLEDLLLDNVEITRETLGSLGTYGKVSKAYYYGSPCAAKEFYNSWTSSILSRDAFDSKGNPKTQLTEVFMEECQQCLKLRHPNVIQFFGVFYKGGSGKGDTTGSIPGPVLVMEKMGDVLTNFLKETPLIDMSCKLSILLDIIQGLVYLHSQNPKIVHGAIGGLTSNNVLLTDSSRPQAKITGDPKIHYFLKKHIAKKPDDKALSEFLPHGTKWDCLHPSLDVFCYGGIMLHTLTQEWPKPLVMYSPSGVKSSSGSKSTIEIDRRLEFIKKVDDHVLKTLIKSCLDNNAKSRPSVIEVQESVKNVIRLRKSTAAAAVSSTTPVKIVQKNKKPSKREVKVTTEQNDLENRQKIEKDREIQQRDVIIQEHANEIALKNKEIQEKESVIKQKKDEIELKNKEIQKKDIVIKRQKDEIDLKNKKIQENEIIIKQQKGEIEQMHHKLYETENELKVLNQQSSKCTSKLQHTESQIETGRITQSKDEELHNKAELLVYQKDKEDLMKRSMLTNNVIYSEEKIYEDENGQNRIKKAKVQNTGAMVQKQKEVDLLPAKNMCKIVNLSDHVIANKPVQVTVTLRDIHGNPIINCGDSIKVVVQSSKQYGTKTLPIKSDELGNGQYVVSFVINEDGECNLVICVGNRSIIEPPHRIRCVQYPQQAEFGSLTRPVRPLRNASCTSCYFNSVLQVLNQTTGFVEMVLKCSEGGDRTYKLRYKNDDADVDIELPITLSGIKEDAFLFIMNIFLKKVECDTSQIIQPDYVLQRLTVNSKQERFGQNTQEDSHELLRYLLYEMKKEETELIKDGVRNYFGINSQYASNPEINKETKLIIKSLLRTASKVTVPIDKVFGGVKLSTVICRECHTPLQTEEPFFDISLGVPEIKQRTTLAYNSGQSFSRGRSSNLQYAAQSTSYGYGYDHRYTSYATSYSSTYGGQNYGMQYGRRGGEKLKESCTYDKKSVKQLLVSNKMFYQPIPDNTTSDIDALDDVQASLAEHTDVDNMDEDNKFICKSCTEQKGASGRISDDDIVLSLVAKQIMIHRLPQALIIHFKRFNIGTYSVTKNSNHVSFSQILNMAPYCSNECLEMFSDLKGKILYGLYGVVEHVGQSLQHGHYIAYVRRRPKRQKRKPAENNTWIYDCEAAYDGKWFYTSDLTVRECTWGFEVKDCKAYMLFYELLPGKPYGTGV